MATCQTADSHAPASSFANAYQVCRETRLSNYRLLKASAMGVVRTQTTPFGDTRYHVGDARRLAEGARG